MYWYPARPGIQGSGADDGPDGGSAFPDGVRDRLAQEFGTGFGEMDAVIAQNLAGPGVHDHRVQVIDLDSEAFRWP